MLGGFASSTVLRSANIFHSNDSYNCPSGLRIGMKDLRNSLLQEEVGIAENGERRVPETAIVAEMCFLLDIGT